MNGKNKTTKDFCYTCACIWSMLHCCLFRPSSNKLMRIYNIKYDFSYSQFYYMFFFLIFVLLFFLSPKIKISCFLFCFIRRKKNIQTITKETRDILILHKGCLIYRYNYFPTTRYTKDCYKVLQNNWQQRKRRYCCCCMYM